MRMSLVLLAPPVAPKHRFTAKVQHPPGLNVLYGKAGGQAEYV
jgi:hypothetical protein